MTIIRAISLCIKIMPQKKIKLKSSLTSLGFVPFLNKVKYRFWDMVVGQEKDGSEGKLTELGFYSLLLPV